MGQQVLDVLFREEAAAHLPAACLPPCSVLDAWVKGSVLTSGAIFLENTLTRRQSRQLTLDSAVKGDAKVLAGPTNDGWYHIQVGAGQV